MCWYINIEITPLDSAKRYDAQFLENISREYQIEGKFPRFTINRGHCLCDVFQPDFDRTSLRDLLNEILSNAQTKKIRVMKYWSYPQPLSGTTDVTVEDFGALLLQNQLQEGAQYQLIDRSKFAYGETTL